MPACASCKMLDRNGQVCLVAHPKPLRSCITPIIEEYHSLFSPGCRVLEIGCGAWSPSKEFCEQNKMVWEGIDVLQYYMGRKTIATKIASVGDLPYPESSFDFVVGNQSLEHWDENHVPIRKGLSEVFRVLKPGGTALFNVPIHFHGDYLFVEGDLAKIREVFMPFCGECLFESWRRPSSPLKEIKHLNRSFRHRPELANANAYILDIRAKKKVDVVPYFNDEPKLAIYRLMEGIRKKGFQYYIHLVLQKISLHLRKRLKK